MEQKERESDNIELRSEKVRNVIGKVQRTMQVFVPYKYLYLFDEPRTAHVSFEGNDNASYNCNIISHNAKLIHREDGNYFMAIATVSTQGQNTPILQKYMKADVRIIVSNKTLWQQVFG